MQLVTPAPGSDLFNEAKALGDSESKNIGLLPHAAWDDYAASGRLLVATAANKLVGYALYRIPRNEVRIAHLVIKPEARGQGIARLLVTEIASRHQQRRGIGLRCRRDWVANSAWPALGFVSIGEREGRGAERLPLTEWWYDFGHPDLLSWAPGDSTVTAIIDANIFIDLHSLAPNTTAEQTRTLIASLSDRVDLVVTPELLNELNRQPDDHERTRLISIARSYPTVRATVADVDDAMHRLTSRLKFIPSSTQDRSDARHIAWAMATGISVLITRDQTARRRWTAASVEESGVTICTPSTLVAVVHSKEESGAYTPAALSGTEFETQEVSSTPDAALVFLDTGGSERRSEFERRMEEVSASRPHSRLTLVRDATAEPAALLGIVPNGRVLSTPLVRVQPGPLAQTLAAQMTQQLRNAAADLDCTSIRLTDPHAPGEVLKACQADGFVRDGAHNHIALTLPGLVKAHDLANVIDKALAGHSTEHSHAIRSMLSMLSVQSPAALEHALRPLHVVDADIPTWLVPIQRQWASDLFGYPEMLLPRSNSLGLSTEHVYYKAGRAGETSPGRILWYASKPTSAVFACSLLVDVQDGSAHDLYRRYQRLGVYSYADVRKIEESAGSVRALNVTDSVVLPSPVPLGRLRQLAETTGDSLNLVGSKKMSASLFASLMTEGLHRG